MNKRTFRQTSYRFKSRLSQLGWSIRFRIRAAARTLRYHVATQRAHPDLRSTEGFRFIELSDLMSKFMKTCLDMEPGLAAKMGSQLLSVLKHCDEITYEEPGTAHAYAFLHFLNRYHRFQLTFAALNAQGLVPKPNRRLDVLDIGTGPGPSMFAASDFLATTLTWKPDHPQGPRDKPFRIDYVERSNEFRNWLHHFTEFTNSQSPTRVPWHVPFHHGTFHDFKDIQFNQEHAFFERDGDEQFLIRSTTHHRFDLAIFSNFLTTADQVRSFAREIQDCARYLRRNGILIIVGAPNRSKKYQVVYEELNRLIVGSRLGTRQYFAYCEEVQLYEPILSFDWGDPYGSRLKEITRQIYSHLKQLAPDSVPLEAASLIESSLAQGYSKPIEWEIRVFRKVTKPRVTKTSKRRKLPIKAAAISPTRT